VVALNLRGPFRYFEGQNTGPDSQYPFSSFLHLTPLALS
jgi:hypothetical protein